MPDSKISDLPLSPYLLDRDLMVVVTGNYNEGSYPQSCKVPVSYIRRYITRPNLFINTTSGVDSYYHPETNILDIVATGLNAYGNNLIQVGYNSTWPYSGIISTTGLNINQTTGNLITNHVQNTWPYQHVLHTTGLNLLDGDNTGYCISETWPYKYRISTVSRSKYSSNVLSISNNTDTGPDTKQILDPDLKISYKGFFLSKGYQSLNLYANTKFRVNIEASSPPLVPGIGLTNARKNLELQTAPTGIVYTYRFYQTNENNNTVIVTDTRTKEVSIKDWENLGYTFVANSCTFSMNLSGNNVTNMQNALVFQNQEASNSSPVFYAVNGYGDLGYGTFPISHDANVRPYLNSFLETSLNTTGPQYNLSNIRYNRSYRVLLATSPVDGPIYYYYGAFNLFSATSATIYNNRYFALTNINDNDNCSGNNGSTMSGPGDNTQNAQDRVVVGGSYSSGILTLNRLGMPDLNIPIPATLDGNNYVNELTFNNNTRTLIVGRNGLSSLTVNIPASDSIVGAKTYRTVYDDQILLNTDDIILVNALGNNVTLTLPSATTMSGRVLVVKIVQIGSNRQCQILPQPGELIDSSSFYLMKYKNLSISLFAENNNWWII